MSKPNRERMRKKLAQPIPLSVVVLVLLSAALIVAFVSVERRQAMKKANGIWTPPDWVAPTGPPPSSHP